MSLTLEAIDNAVEDYPYWLLGRRLAYYLDMQGVITLPMFPEETRYRELNSKETSYEESVEYEYEDEVDCPPLTPEEKLELEKLCIKFTAYNNQLSEIYEKFCQTTKKSLLEFDLKMDAGDYSFGVLTTSQETLEQLKTIFGDTSNQSIIESEE